MFVSYTTFCNLLDLLTQFTHSYILYSKLCQNKVNKVKVTSIVLDNELGTMTKQYQF